LFCLFIFSVSSFSLGRSGTQELQQQQAGAGDHPPSDMVDGQGKRERKLILRCGSDCTLSAEQFFETDLAIFSSYRTVKKYNSGTGTNQNH